MADGNPVLRGIGLGAGLTVGIIAVILVIIAGLAVIGLGCCCCMMMSYYNTTSGQPSGIPDTVGLSKNNPAGIHEIITCTPSDLAATMYGSTYTITLLDVKKGNEANDLMEEYNFLASPGSGNDFILAKFRVEVMDTTTGGSFKISEGDFQAVSPDGTQVYPYNIWKYNPSISTEVYSGGTAEGWVCLVAPKGVSYPLIVFDRDYNGKDGIWFRI